MGSGKNRQLNQMMVQWHAKQILKQEFKDNKLESILLPTRIGKAFKEEQLEETYKDCRMYGNKMPAMKQY